MLAEAFAKPGTRGGLALGATIVFAAGVAFAVGVWLDGVEDVAERSTRSRRGSSSIASRSSSTSLLCLGGALAALLAGGYLPEHKLERGEFYSLLLFATVGAMMLAAAGDLLIALPRPRDDVDRRLRADRRSAARRRARPKAALKYFLLGSFAAALLLYGFALLYGATGHTDLAGIGDGGRRRAATSTPDGRHRARARPRRASLFKVSAVPFHMWTPDAYEGAPTPATTFMAVVVKAGAFAMMLRVLLVVLRRRAARCRGRAGWPPVLAWHRGRSR